MRGLVPGDIPVVAAALDTDEVRARGIHINVTELLTYFVSPWIRAYVRVENGKLAGFAVFNISEAHWGRCELQEFWVAPDARSRSSWWFFKWVLARADGCHRITARVKDTNTMVAAYLHRAGWRQEAVLSGFTPLGETYLQYVLLRGAGR
jgi:hypothetical protein